MHLVYITTLKQDYIGQSEIAAEPLMEHVILGSRAVKLEKASVVMAGMDQQGRHMLNQWPLIMSDWFTANLTINSKYIVDIRSIGKDSPIRKTYEKTWKDANAKNSGISVVKVMPKNLSHISNN